MADASSYATRSTSRWRPQLAALCDGPLGFLVFVTYGVGMLIGAQVAGNVFNQFLRDASALTLPQWQSFWWIPALFAAAIMVCFALTFRDRARE